MMVSPSEGGEGQVRSFWQPGTQEVSTKTCLGSCCQTPMLTRHQSLGPFLTFCYSVSPLNQWGPWALGHPLKGPRKGCHNRDTILWLHCCSGHGWGLVAFFIHSPTCQHHSQPGTRQPMEGTMDTRLQWPPHPGHCRRQSASEGGSSLCCFSYHFCLILSLHEFTCMTAALCCVMFLICRNATVA